MKIDIPARLTGLFFISGFAALIYQVVWQRILFTTFGINADSVTVIVSVFMFGLGMGTLAGNWLQKKFPHRLLDCFIAIEIGIGLFGLLSIPLIKQASAFAPPDSLLALMGITYAVLALPTLLMGATLPLLVTYLNLHFANIGQTVGKLYAFNTLGSAIAALMTVSFLFVVTGQQGALTLAFCCNILTAFLTYRLRRFALGKAATNRKTIPKNAIPFALALLLSATAGYVGLSLQMFWFRTIGFMSSGRSEAFGLILFLFLCGVAGGSRKTEQLSEAGENLALFIVKSLALLALSIYVSLVIVAAVASLDQVLGTYVAYGFLALQARISGGIFPALCHLGIKQSAKVQPGIAVGWMYFSNIIGATLGTILTGFVLFDILTLVQNLTLISALVCIVLFFAMPVLQSQTLNKLKPVICLLGIAMLGLHPALHQDIFRKIQPTSEGGSFIRTIENRSGIITVESNVNGDIIYGGGVYDGRFNIDPAISSNHILRAYMLAALHPKPERVLEIGLGSGSWTKVLSLYEPLKQLTVIEINSGYTKAIEAYPELKGILTHPKIQLHVDDGRRWLDRHPQETFDAIVMNTTFYWRSNATNLLSREFLQLVKSHLKPGGIILYNTTGALDSVYTAAHVFKYVVVFENAVAASDSPFIMSEEQKRANLLAFIDDKKTPIFAQVRTKKILEDLVHYSLPDVGEEVRARKDLWLITDDNMATEYKKGTLMSPSLYQSLWGN